MKRPIAKTRKNERGQALVEFAILLPVLLFLVVGIIEFSRAWNAHQVLTDAAREGARNAVVANSETQTDVENRIRNYFSQSGFDGSQATITFPLGFKTGAGNSTAVRVEFPYRFIFLKVFMQLAFGSPDGTVTLATEAVMRNE